MKIYTKSGDKGQTSLYDSKRVDKDDIRVESYGTIDELNSFIGAAKNHIDDEEVLENIDWIQHKLFSVAGELATTDGQSFATRVTDEDVKQLETWIDMYLERIGRDVRFQFTLPGSNQVTADLHIARTVCRRAERRMITLSKQAEISDTVLKFVNRLSDCLYTYTRYFDESTVGKIERPKKPSKK